jgi:hypothetical protein
METEPVFIDPLYQNLEEVENTNITHPTVPVTPSETPASPAQTIHPPPTTPTTPTTPTNSTNHKGKIVIYNLDPILDYPDATVSKTLIQQDLSQIRDHDPNMSFEIPLSELSRQNYDSENQVKLQDYLKSPDMDEVRTLARDGENGGLKKLNQDQLNQIHAEGKFTVPSERFAPQVHEWEVKNFFQKGVKDSVETFKNGIALCTQHFVIFIPNRLWRHDDFSFWAGLKSFVTGIGGIAVQLVGSVERKTVFPNESEKKILRLETLLSNWLSDEIVVTTKDIHSGQVKRISTFDGFHISTDLTFSDSEMRKKLMAPYQEFMKQWKLSEPQRRQNLAKELSSQFSSEELAQEVVNAEALLLQEEIFKIIHSTFPDEDGEMKDANARDLCNLMLAVQLIRDAMKHYKRTRENALHIYMNGLKQRNTILSRLPKWMDLKRASFLKKYDRDHPVDQVLASWSAKLSGQEKYIFDSNMAVNADVQNAIKKATRKEPGRVFEWEYHIWRPSKYVVIEHERDNGSRWFEMSKYNKFETTSNYPGWRFGNIFLRIGQYFANGLRGLIAWTAYGPLGFRSLVGLDDYQPAKTVDRDTGKLVPTGSKFATWFGRIRNLWTHIRKCVDEFNSKPDNGTFGKTLQKPFVVGFWNYFCKGVFGTLFSFLFHPILAGLNIVISGGLILSSPVWSIALSLLRYLVDMFIYDFDSTETDVSFFSPQDQPNQYQSREWFPLPRLLISDILVLGLGRMIAAPAVALGNVAVGGIGYCLSLLRYGLTRVWDNLMYYCLWKPFGRVPNRNDYFSTRIRGPGLSMTYYQVIKPDLAILMIKYLIEKDRVKLISNALENHINEPSNNLIAYFSQFEDIGLMENKSGALTTSFLTTRKELKKKLEETIRKHFDNLIIDGTAVATNNVRLTKNDLISCISVGKEICQAYCEMYQTNFSADWWSSKAVVVGDYENLAIYFLKQGFGNAIIQPIEEADPSGFRIDIDESTMPKYVKMVCKGTSDAFSSTLEKSVVEKPLVPNDKYPNDPTNITIVTPFNLDQVEREEQLITLRPIESNRYYEGKA